MISRTAPRNGGKPISKEVFLAIVPLTFWNWNYRQAFVSVFICRAYCKDDIIFRHRQGGFGYFSDRLDMLPFRTSSCAPEHFITRCPSTGFPRQCRVVFQAFGQYMDLRRWCRC